MTGKMTYDRAFANALASVLAHQECLQRRREAAAALAAALEELPPRRQTARIKALSRSRPWEVAGALLDHAAVVLSTSPGRAQQLASLAAIPLAAIPANEDPDDLRSHLDLERICLLADASIHLGKLLDADAILGAAAPHVSGPLHRASCCLALARLRRAQGRLDEHLALLHRAAVLFTEADDEASAADALVQAEEVQALFEKRGVKP